MIVLLVMIHVHVQEFYCANTREYTNIPSRLRLVPPKEGIFVYTLVKSYYKANLFQFKSVVSKITMML